MYISSVAHADQGMSRRSSDKGRGVERGEPVVLKRASWSSATLESSSQATNTSTISMETTQITG